MRPPDPTLSWLAPVSEERYSRKRPRKYHRSVDYDEVRRLVKSGRTRKSVAKQFGISRALVYLICKWSDKTFGEPKFVPLERRCRECGGPRSSNSKALCKECAQIARLVTPKMVRRSAEYDVPLAAVRFGRVVYYAGRYAVVERRSTSNRWRTLHFWDGPPQKVSVLETVDVPAYTEVEDAYRR